MKGLLFRVLIFILLAFFVTAKGQDFHSRIDSLEAALQLYGKDTSRVNILIQLALEYRQYSTSMVIEYANQALEISNAIGYRKGIAGSYNRLGSFYRQTGNYDKAVDYYLKALMVYEEDNDLKGMSFCYNGLGVIFRIQQLYDKAIEFQQKALDIAILQYDSVGISIYLRNIGVCFYDQGNFNESLRYAKESYEIAKKADVPSITISSLQAVGNSYHRLGETKKAIEYFNHAYKLGVETANRYSEVYSLHRLADCHRDQGNYSRAEKMYYKALEKGKELGVKHDIKDAYLGLSLLYEKIRDYKQAYQNHLLYTHYNDSIFTLESAQKISELEQVYEIEQNRLEIELLKKDNQYNSIKIKRQRLLTFTFILGFILTFSYVFLLILRNRRKHRINTILKRQNQEILEHKREIEEQSTELKKLSIVASHTNNAIMIINYNGDMHWVNDAFTRIYGFTIDEFIDERGKNILRVNDQPEVRRNIEKCILDHKPITYNAQVNCKDGAKIWIQTTMTPIKDNDGSIQNFVAIDTDISELKRFENHLLKLGEELSARAKDLKEKNEEITDQRDSLTELNAELVQKNEEIQSQHDYLAELNAELHTKNEEILAQRDELERTQTQLVQSEKMASLGVLTAGIAHEINNPINFVYAGVNVLKRDFEDLSAVLDELLLIDDAKSASMESLNRICKIKDEHGFEEAYNAIKQTLEDIELGARRTAEIVEGLRNYARTEKEEWVEIDPHKVIEGVLLLLKNNYKDRIAIKKNYKANGAIIHCKAGRLDQAFLNIVSNAIDAIEEEGEILISSTIDNKHFQVSIKDSGTGMSEEVKNKIFDPFYTTKQVGKGLGLGLSITYGIIQEHNGSIMVSSQLGKGTEFIINLPISQTD